MGCILEVARGSSSSKHGDDACEEQVEKIEEAKEANEANAGQANFKASSMHQIRWNFASHPLIQSVFLGFGVYLLDFVGISFLVTCCFAVLKSLCRSGRTLQTKQGVR